MPSTLSSGYSVRKLWRKPRFTKKWWNREWGKAEEKVERFLGAFDVPQCRRVQFNVHKIDDFKSHRDAQSSQCGDRRFEPWDICSFKKKPRWSVLCCTSRAFLRAPGPVSRSYVTETLDQCKSDWKATAVDTNLYWHLLLSSILRGCFGESEITSNWLIQDSGGA